MRHVAMVYVLLVMLTLCGGIYGGTASAESPDFADSVTTLYEFEAPTTNDADKLSFSEKVYDIKKLLISIYKLQEYGKEIDDELAIIGQRLTPEEIDDFPEERLFRFRAFPLPPELKKKQNTILREKSIEELSEKTNEAIEKIESVPKFHSSSFKCRSDYQICRESGYSQIDCDLVMIVCFIEVIF